MYLTCVRPKVGCIVSQIVCLDEGSIDHQRPHFPNFGRRFRMMMETDNEEILSHFGRNLILFHAGKL